ncbi:2-isopropylmalate synthase (Alpha-isopropylmalate synthase) (Alpha-IPM synthetase) [Tieghemiomyces parasiticus]|uniref:2-isopropylmalate synthase n=1 Tax=Tieghemiomyces parasiticus TaxID=78921 RepID=A0A9W8AFX8_9FUNG|nr:2-isopropylmalate synthase (Alpha-isopropylmalate synthase) (Alpha-IPM synthetase) [Tieghemiomyces parasiticus]
MCQSVTTPSPSADLRTIYFSDTSLRDGEQAPDVNFSTDDKIAIAKQLSLAGVDEIEVGFPAASPTIFNACQRIAREVGSLMEGRESTGKPVRLSALARTLEADIDTVYEAMKDAPRFSIRIFSATSDIHLEHKLCITREECLTRISRAIAYARRYTDHVQFAAEDGGRSDPDFLCQANQAAIDAGAVAVFLTDTVGSLIPSQIYKMVRHCLENTTYPPEFRWGLHIHNDLGLGTANALAGIEAGISSIDATFTGIGERAGNAAIEEIAMVLTTHPEHYQARHQLNTRMFTSICNTIADLGGTTLAPNKPIVGRNVFRHTSGIHQHGLLRNRSTYEYLDPEMVGATSDGLILSKLSGRSAFQARLERLKIENLDLSPDHLNQLFSKFKILAEDRTEVTDSDLRRLVETCS